MYSIHINSISQNKTFTDYILLPLRDSFFEMLPLRDYSFPYADNEDQENDCAGQCENASSPTYKTYNRNATESTRTSRVDFVISRRSTESLVEDLDGRYSPNNMTYRRRQTLKDCDESSESSTVLKGTQSKQGFYQIIRRGACYILEEIVALIEGREKSRFNILLSLTS